MLNDAIREIPEFPAKVENELKHCIPGTPWRTGIRFPEETCTDGGGSAEYGR